MAGKRRSRKLVVATGRVFIVLYATVPGLGRRYSENFSWTSQPSAPPTHPESNHNTGHLLIIANYQAPLAPILVNMLPRQSQSPITL